MKKKNNNNPIVNFICAVLFVAGVIGFMLLIFSCNPVKKVNKDEKKQLKVIENYSKKHPAKNDTTYLYKKGDTITNVVENLDTLYLETLPDTVKDVKYRYINKTITITKTVRDTVFRNVIDRTKEIALQNIINGKDSDIINLKTELAEMTYKRDRWRIYFFISLLLNTLFLYFRIRKLFI